MKDGTSWTVARERLRRFEGRAGWTVGQISHALRVRYGAMLNTDAVERLLHPAAVNPRNRIGLAAVVELCADLRSEVPAFERWQRQFERNRAIRDFRAEGDALRARADAVEQAREARRRALLASEPKHCRRIVVPSSDPLAGLDAATIAVLSGGTIIMRGVRL